MIRIENLSKSFNKGLATEIAGLKNVSLDIPAGEFAVVIGANGSGKSTLLNCIAGSIRADRGNIYIDETNISSLPEYLRSRFISRIFQNPATGTAPDLTILENFRLASLRTTKKGVKIGTVKKFAGQVKDKISFLKMGLENNVDRLMGSLSGGQRQALTLVMGIMDESKVMLLDEPAAALDPKSSILVMEKASDIISTHKLTAILVTHNLKDALHFGNRLLLMQEGTIVSDYDLKKKQSLTIEELLNMF